MYNINCFFKAVRFDKIENKVSLESLELQTLKFSTVLSCSAYFI